MHGLTVAGFVFHLRGRRRKFLEKLLTAQFFFFSIQQIDLRSNLFQLEFLDKSLFR